MLDFRRDRLDYGMQLIPPPGYELRRAVGATFSLDLNTLLSIPVALLYAQTLEGIAAGESVQLLEAIRRCPEVLRIYHQQGKLHVPRQRNRLYGLLEDCVVGVSPRNEFSSFHPKVWVLRFEGEAGPARYRVLVLSRNLTYDRSWDLAAVLEGEISDEPQPRNQPLVDFLGYLHEQEPFEGDATFLDGLRRARFSPPPGFGPDFRFHPIGIARGYSHPLKNQQGDRLICVSPFVQEAALDDLRRMVPGERWLFGRKEELRRLPPGALAGFHTYVLAECIVDGEALTTAEDGGDEGLQQNLHAKLFVYQRGQRGSVWYLGSANATQAALERNVEFLLELRAGSESARLDRLLDQLLGPKRDLRVFEPFAPDDVPVDHARERALEMRVRRLEFDLLTELKIIRAELEPAANGANYDLWLAFDAHRVAWADLAVRVSPFNSGCDPQPVPHDGTALCFENIGESCLSRFLSFEIFHLRECCRAFLLKVEIEGMPEDRETAIIRAVVSDPDRFFAYLRFLLAEGFEKETAGEIVGMAGSAGTTGASELGWGFSSPVFEQLLITAARRPHRLEAIDQLVAQLSGCETTDGRQVVPREFLDFWRAFQGMLPPRERKTP